MFLPPHLIAIVFTRAERDCLDVLERERRHQLVTMASGRLPGTEYKRAKLHVACTFSANDVGIILASKEERDDFC